MTESQRNYFKSLAVAGGTAAVGVLAEAVGAPWLLAIVAAVLAAPGPVRKLLTSFEFATTVVVVLTVCTAVGTLDYALGFFSALWFKGLLGLMGLSSLLCLIFRYNSGRGIPYVIIHLSILVLLIGAALKDQLKETGMVHLRRGETTNTMQIMRDGELTSEVTKLPFSVRLDRFKVEFYDSAVKLFVFRHQDEGPAAEIPTVEGAKATVDGVTIEFVSLQDHPYVPAPGHPPVQVKMARVLVDGKAGLVLRGRPVLSGDLAMVLDEKSGEPKSYQSTLSVVDEKGEDVLTRSVVVNDPLVYGGWWLYQSNWDPRDLSYSGILLVKDPGLYVSIAGLVMLVAGTLAKIRFRKRTRAGVLP